MKSKIEQDADTLMRKRNAGDNPFLDQSVAAEKDDKDNTKDPADVKID